MHKKIDQTEARKSMHRKVDKTPKRIAAKNVFD